MKLTTKHMDSNPTDRNQWFVESGQRGEGTFLGRITPQGNKLFYFRYTGPDRRQVRMTIGFYAKPGSSGGLTVAEARAVALEWATLYKSGIRDLREHFASVATTKASEEAEAAQQAQAESARGLSIRVARAHRSGTGPRHGG